MHFIYCCINTFPPFCLNICEPFLFTPACQFDLGTVYDEQGKQMTFLHSTSKWTCSQLGLNLICQLYSQILYFTMLTNLPQYSSQVYIPHQFFLTYRTRIQSTTYNIYYSLPQATFLHAARSLLNILKLHLNPSITHYFLP